MPLNTSVVAWNNFLQDVERARKQLAFQSDEGCFYRGHSDDKYNLTPSLLRNTNGRALRGQKLKDIECDLFFEFRSRAKSLHLQGYDDWDILFAMRHYGLPTRILDWTDIFGIALFFAIDSFLEGKQPCIWMLNPYRLNRQSWGFRDIIAPEYLLKEGWTLGDYLQAGRPWEWDEPVAIFPDQKIDRMYSQSGWFTIHGNKHKPLDVQVASASKCVKLPIKAIPEAKRFLTLAGISPRIVYPDLEGLAEDLTRAYKFK